MMKTFALRGRGVPLTIYGPPGLGDLFGALRRVFGRLTPGTSSRRCGPETCRPRRLRPRRVRGGARGGAVGYALVEHGGPAGSTSQAADALGVPNGPERGALQRGEAVTVVDGPR